MRSSPALRQLHGLGRAGGRVPAREAVRADGRYKNEYERAIKSLKKWTDAFVALMVSCNLIVSVSLISNMIYQHGAHVHDHGGGVAIISAAGCLLIYRIAHMTHLVHNTAVKSRSRNGFPSLARCVSRSRLWRVSVIYFGGVA